MERTVTTEDGRFQEHRRRGIELMVAWAAEDAAVIDLRDDAEVRQVQS